VIPLIFGLAKGENQALLGHAGDATVGRRACISTSTDRDCTAGRKGRMGAMNAIAEWDGGLELAWRRCEGKELDEREVKHTESEPNCGSRTGRSLWRVLRMGVARQPNE
jgi:hypothetical protein